LWKAGESDTLERFVGKNNTAKK
jgi:hypothetical protein